MELRKLNTNDIEAQWAYTTALSTDEDHYFMRIAKKEPIQLQLINDDYLGHVDHLRNASRGILVKDGKVLLCYESNNDKYIIPGGGVEENETYLECCEREMLEETGMKVRAAKEFLIIEELFDVWQHFSHYFLCELVEDTGNPNLTEAEERAGYTCEWKTLDEALEIFGKYEDFHESNIADYGLYKREYAAIKEYMKLCEG